MFQSPKKQPLILTAIFAIAVGYRLWGVTNPLLDFHGWRQTATASIARNFYENGLNIFKPQLDTMQEGTKALYGVEFQLYPFLVALFYFLFGVHEIIGRLVSLLFGIGALGYLFLLAKRHFGEKTALYAAFFFAVLPMMVYYTRTFQPEAAMIFFSVAALFHFDRWIETEKNSHYALTLTFSLCAFLVKIPTLYILFPMGYIAACRFGKKILFKPKLIAFLAVTLLPTCIWYALSPKLIGSASLFEAEGKWATLSILFSADFYQKIFLTRLGELMFAFTGVPLLLAGFFLPCERKEQRFLHCWFFSVLLYIFVTAQGNLQHEYYQLPIIPCGVIFMGRGAEWLMNRARCQGRVWYRNYLLWGTMGLILFIPFHSIYKLHQRLAVDWNALRLARQVEAVTQKGDLIIVNDNGEPEILYYSHRKGWHAGGFGPSPEDLEIKRSKGAQYFVTAFTDLPEKNKILYDFLESRYQKIWSGTEGMIHKLDSH